MIFLVQIAREKSIFSYVIYVETDSPTAFKIKLNIFRGRDIFSLYIG